jgi:hypothetical protein
MRRLRVVGQLGPALAVCVCAIVALRAGAEPKAYAPLVVALVLIGLGWRWRMGRRYVRIIVAYLAAALCLVLVVSHWAAFPLSKAATARLLEAQRPAEGAFRCVSPPRPGGYPEFGRQLFGRTFVCGSSSLWDRKGGIRLGQGFGVSVDDTHIVRMWP